MEEKIKNQLEKRRIEPSKHLWAELENALDKADTNSQKKYWWIGIAASFFIGGLITYAIVFNQTPAQNQKSLYTPNLSMNTTISNVKSSNTASSLNRSPQIAATTDLSTKKEEQSTKQNAKQQSIAPKKSIIKLKPVAFKQLATVSTPQTEVNQSAQAQKSKIAEKKEVKQTKKTISEADRLLRAAQKEIAYKNIIDDAKNDVNPDMLLHEAQLKKSNSMGEFLKKSIQKRTKVVADK